MTATAGIAHAPWATMKTSIALFSALVMAALFPGCESGPNTQRGAATGAAAGALIGGIIGHQSGDTTAGAAIGAAAGGLAGGAYGRRQDAASGTYGAGRDSYGYTSSDYLSLVNESEYQTLRSRAQGSSGTDLASYLTSEEKANLRARADRQGGIGR
jgi:uncharacterized protein YcfJ